jgi:hypothetical protein
MSDREALQMLADADGCVALGALQPGVFYARLSRSLSRQVGEAFARRLAAALEETAATAFFVDARALESYDLAARAAFLRVVRAGRCALSELNLLPWRGPVSAELLAALGQPTRLFSEAREFETRLFKAAPGAPGKFALRPELVRRSRWPDPR